MRAVPRYDGPPVIDLTPMAFDPSPVLQQRDRLAETLSQLSADEWTADSRCAGWSVQDVAEHLVSVNRFWVFSISAGLRGEPSRLLETFDPVAVPAAMVEAARGAAPAETLEKLVASNAEMAAVVSSASASDLQRHAEAPPGHLAINAVLAHALWDAWVHERDVLLPLGREQVVDADEVAMALAYVAALGPACYVNARRSQPAVLAVRAHDPSLDFAVEVSADVQVRPGSVAEPAAAIEGAAVDLVEALSCRAPQAEVIGDHHHWLVDGLAKVFNSPV